MYDTSFYTRPYIEKLYYQEFVTGLIVILVIFAIIGGIIAYVKGRSVLGWALLCLFFGFIPLIVIAALPSLKHQNNYPHNDSKSSVSSILKGEQKCKNCGKTVDAGYSGCPYCGGELLSSNLFKLNKQKTIIRCPFCNNTIKQDISANSFVNIKCAKCGKKITEENMIIEDT